jgi:membrane protein
LTGFMEHEAPQTAGSMAYYAVLSLFQLLVLGVVVASFFLGEGQAREFVLEQAEAAAPLDVETAEGVIDSVIEDRGGIGLVSGVLLLWGALGLFSAIQRGINAAFPKAEKRPFIKDKLIGLALIALVGALALASVVIGIATGIINQVVADVADVVPGGALVLTLIDLIVPLLLIFAAFMIIYRVVPNRPVAFGEVWPGALVAAVLWTVLRLGFTYYATNIADYDSAFGPISTAITLLVFLYFASMVVVVGAEFARANVVDSELSARARSGVAAGQPQDQPAMVGPTATLATVEPPRRGISRWFLVAAAGVIGLVLGRKSRGED